MGWYILIKVMLWGGYGVVQHDKTIVLICRGVLHHEQDHNIQGNGSVQQDKGNINLR